MSSLALVDAPQIVTDLTRSRWLFRVEESRPWTAKLVFTRHDDDGSVAGHLNWMTPAGDSRGRERFSGTLDPVSLELLIESVAMRCASGLAPSTYEARLTPDGSALVNGTWSGTGHNSGKWSAVADPASDLSGDDRVGSADLAWLLAAWGPCSPDECPLTCGPDLNVDGRVDAEDLAILLTDWGRSVDR